MNDLYRVRDEYIELRRKIEQTDSGLYKAHENLINLDNTIKNNYLINYSSAACGSIISYNNEVVRLINYIRITLLPAIDEEIRILNERISCG